MYRNVHFCAAGDRAVFPRMPKRRANEQTREGASRKVHVLFASRCQAAFNYLEYSELGENLTVQASLISWLGFFLFVCCLACLLVHKRLGFAHLAYFCLLVRLNDMLSEFGLSMFTEWAMFQVIQI